MVLYTFAPRVRKKQEQGKRVRVKDILTALESFAPLSLQDDFDNAGLQIGSADDEVSGVLLCLDVTPEVIEEAVKEGCSVVVSHHPLLFKSLRRVSDGTMVEKCVRLAVKNDVTVYSAHTNLDNAEGGVNFEIARRLDLQNVSFLSPSHDGVGGSGVIGELAEKEDSRSFLLRVKQVFGVERLMCNGTLSRPIRRVALCGGAGDFLLEKAISAGADCFLTGEVHYHVYFGHEEQIQIAAIGHYESERYTVDLLARRLQELFPELMIKKTKINTNPIQYL